MKKFATNLLKTLTVILAIFGLIFIVLLVRYWDWLPLVDRVVIRPCYYYPQVFIDCK